MKPLLLWICNVSAEWTLIALLIADCFALLIALDLQLQSVLSGR